jgi:hypothetical protein
MHYIPGIIVALPKLPLVLVTSATRRSLLFRMSQRWRRMAAPPRRRQRRRRGMSPHRLFPAGPRPDTIGLQALTGAMYRLEAFLRSGEAVTNSDGRILATSPSGDRYGRAQARRPGVLTSFPLCAAASGRPWVLSENRGLGASDSPTSSSTSEIRTSPIALTRRG